MYTLPKDLLREITVAAGLSGRKFLQLNKFTRDAVTKVFMTTEEYYIDYVVANLPAGFTWIDAMDYVTLDYKTWEAHFPWDLLVCYLAGQCYYHLSPEEKTIINDEYANIAYKYLMNVEADHRANPGVDVFPTWYFCILPEIFADGSGPNMSLLEVFAEWSYWGRGVMSHVSPDYSLIRCTWLDFDRGIGEKCYDATLELLRECGWTEPFPEIPPEEIHAEIKKRGLKVKTITSEQLDEILKEMRKRK